MSEKKFDGYEPLYIQVSDSIKNDIREGKLIRGEKLSNEAELAKELEVSRGTIRKSLSLLNEEGYVETVHGKGTFVRNDKISSPIAQQFVSFEEDMRNQGLNFETKVLTKEVISVDDSIHYELKMADNTKVLYLERLRLVNNEPSILLYNWIPIDRCPGIEKYDFTNIGLFEAMEETMGEKINHGIREFSALNADDYIQKVLNLPNDAVLKINQKSFDDNNEPIEYSEVYLRTDNYQVTSLLQR
ncbi:GntR family transcriptional regulator [Carnobacteriaceae bacterium 52-44]